MRPSPKSVEVKISLRAEISNATSWKLAIQIMFTDNKLKLQSSMMGRIVKRVLCEIDIKLVLTVKLCYQKARLW